MSVNRAVGTPPRPACTQQQARAGATPCLSAPSLLCRRLLLGERALGHLHVVAVKLVHERHHDVTLDSHQHKARVHVAAIHMREAGVSAQAGGREGGWQRAQAAQRARQLARDSRRDATVRAGDGSRVDVVLALVLHHLVVVGVACHQNINIQLRATQGTSEDKQSGERATRAK